MTLISQNLGMLFNQLIFNTTKFWNIYLTFFFLAALEKAISLSVDGADVSTICGTIDNFIEEEL